MTKERKQEIISNLMKLYNDFEPYNEFEPEMTLFDLISAYNQKYENTELIGGQWVIDNCPSPLKDLRP